MSDERLKILQMLEEKKITLDAAATLIEALEGQKDGSADRTGIRHRTQPR
jgi:hypothetical protein